MRLKMKKINIYLIGLSVLFVLFFIKGKTTKILENIVPKVKLEIKNIDENKKDLIVFTNGLDFKFDKNNSNIEIISKGKYGYSQEALWLKDRTAKLEIEMKKSPSSKISFYNIGTDKIEISSNKSKEIINLGDKSKGELVEYYPFQKSKIIFIYSILFYAILIAIIYKILCLLILENISSHKRVKIITNYLKKINVKIFLKDKKNVYLLILSYFLAFCMFSYVNEFVYTVLPEVEITISSLEETIKNVNHITLLEDEDTKRYYDMSEVFLKSKELNENLEGLNYIKKGDYGYSVNAIHVNSSKNRVKIKAKKIPNLKLSFYNVGISEKIKIETAKSTEIVDISENKKGERIDYFPFKESKLFLIYSMSIYLVIGLFIFIAVKFIFFNIKKIKENKFLNGYNPIKMTFIIYLLVSIYVTLKVLTHTLPVTLFYKNLYLRNLFGDQAYYWKIATLIKDFNFGLLQKDIISFRGYFASVVPSIALLISKYTKINAYWLCYMINNFFICLLLGYITPQLYVKLQNKKLENYKIFSLFIIFSIFWKGMYYSVLADMMGVTFLLWAILFVLEYIEKKEKKFAFFSGACSAISALNRGNYVLGIYFVLLWFILNNIFKIIKINKYRIKNNFFLFFFIGMFVICVPQIKLNYGNGHIGMFSYDKKGSWSKKDESLKDEIINHTLRNLLVTWPYSTSDVTAQRILNNFVKEKDTRISFKQGLAAFISYPFDTMILIIKKLFLSLDIKTPEVYPWYNYKTHTHFYLFSFVNYFIISTAIYLIQNKRTRKKFFNKKELLLGGFLFLLFILPQTILHIEWRYYILLYLIIYYVFAFKIFDFLKNRKFKKDSYLKFITTFVIIFFILSSYYFY